MPSNFVQIATESEIRERLEAERARLRKIAGLDQAKHFHRPVERAFTADERSRVLGQRHREGASHPAESRPARTCSPLVSALSNADASPLEAKHDFFHTYNTADTV